MVVTMLDDAVKDLKERSNTSSRFDSGNLLRYKSIIQMMPEK
jgi:hypothetical protein